jgi:four helix bundle protein
MGVALKELNETQIWLLMIQRAELLPATEVETVLDECRQLSRMINASIQTARRNGQ